MLVLAAPLFACSFFSSGDSTPVRAEVLSEEARQIAEGSSPDSFPTVDRDVFSEHIEEACYDAIYFWNSDPPDATELVEDIPLQEGTDDCTSDLLSEWCDEIDCTWPGPWSHGDEDYGHQAANTALKAVSGLAIVAPGDNFIGIFMDELEEERVALGIDP